MKDLPKNFCRLLINWYQKNARVLPFRADTNPYKVWVSEIMLQQTRVSFAIDYFTRFTSALPTVADLANANEQQVLKLWEGLGYYSRARNMQKAAKQIVEKHNGVFPNTFQEIKALPGIGNYTAGAIASICFNLPTPAVDGNVVRVLARVTNTPWEATSDKAKEEIKSLLEPLYQKESARGDLTQGIMELGAMVCIPGTPRCEACPLNSICKAREAGTQAKLPIKTEKKENPVIPLTVFILTCHGKTAIEKRQEKGLLHNLWQFPNLLGHVSKEAALQQVGGTQCLKTKKAQHIFSHRTWDMVAYYIEVNTPNPQFTWVTPEQLKKEIPLPSAFKYFI